MNVADIKPLKPDTDLSKCQIVKFDADTCIRQRTPDGVLYVPYQVVEIKGYYHTIGCRWHREYANDLYAYPRSKEMTISNLVPWDAERVAPTWGIQYEPYVYLNGHWDSDFLAGEVECSQSNYTVITRNGKYFCDAYGIVDAQRKIQLLEDHPLEINNYEWEKKALGRKVWWHDQPAIIDMVCTDASIILVPDGMKYFKKSGWQLNEINRFSGTKDKGVYIDEDNDGPSVKDTIFTNSIYWFRD